MAKVYEAVVHPGSSGFGLWEVGEWCECEGVETLDEWVAEVENAQPYAFEVADHIDGHVNGQNGATIYIARDAAGEGVSVHAVRIEA